VAELPKHIGVAVDLAGCPNRCGHCYLGTGPNRRLSPDVLREVAATFQSWRRSGETTAYFGQVDVASWYREPDFAEDYRQLYELEKELAGREPRRYELLSVWRLARDESYALWAKERGPHICQITFFGMEEMTDRLCGRNGAFKDAIAASECLLAAGMIPRWQVILTKPGLRDLPLLMEKAEQMELARRVSDLGGSFEMFCHPPGPDGEAWNLEDVRIEKSDLDLIPGELLESTRKHFGGTLEWKPESEIVHEALGGHTIPADVPGRTWFFVNADLEVFSNYGDLTPAWRLGNFREDSLDQILASFEEERPPAMRAAFHVPDAELAERFGRKDGTCLYSPSDAKARWVRLACGVLRNR
jgi:MoaA/NifB/PqqE/SkfB family radical SAM enzyme